MHIYVPGDPQLLLSLLGEATKDFLLQRAMTTASRSWGCNATVPVSCGERSAISSGCCSTVCTSAGGDSSFTTSCKASSNSPGFQGLPRKCAAPFLKLRSRTWELSWAVNMITGIFAVREWFLSWSSTARPPILGMTKSNKMASGHSAWAILIPTCPSSAPNNFVTCAGEEEVNYLPDFGIIIDYQDLGHSSAPSILNGYTL